MWQHSFIVIDQNQFRRPDLLSQVLGDCCQSGLRLLIPDVAFFEFSKADCPFDSWQRSLAPLSPYRELICVSRKITEMMTDELQREKACATLVHEEATQFLRSMLVELDRSNEVMLREVVNGPLAKLLPASLESWSDHEDHKQSVIAIHNHLKTTLTAGQLKAMRNAPEQAIANWLSSAEGIRFIFQGIKSRGANDETAYTLMQTSSVTAGFLSALAGLAINWLVFGGLSDVNASKCSNDLNDVEYVVLGALSKSLATADKRASLISQGVAAAFESRRKLPRLDDHVRHALAQ